MIEMLDDIVDIMGWLVVFILSIVIHIIACITIPLWIIPYLIYKKQIGGQDND